MIHGFNILQGVCNHNQKFKSMNHAMHLPMRTTHAPTRARPSLPVVPDPNPAPPNLGPTAIHDTAAIITVFNLFEI